MDDNIHKELRKIINTYSKDICEDRRRCEGILRDSFPNNRREVSLLVNALKENIASDLIRSSKSTPSSVLIANLAKRLYDNIGISLEFAYWSVNTWAFALGIINQAIGYKEEPEREKYYQIEEPHNNIQSKESSNLSNRITDIESISRRSGLVNIENRFHICDHPVTQEEYQRIMGNNPSYFQGMPNNPVEWVSWFNAVRYCNERSRRDGLEPVYNINGNNVTWDESKVGYCLPKASEWKYAAKGGSRSRGYIYSGSNNIDEVAWYDKNSDSRTHPVKEKNPNEYGLYDMTGNIYEWCWDSYKRGSCRLICGGSWNNSAESCTITAWDYGSPDYGGNLIGFRIILTQAKK